jgi:lysophospholipase L1-like esterase
MSRMRCVILFMIVWFMAGVAAPYILQAQESGGYSPENYFAPEIEAFLKQDQVNPPPKGGILFIGSSIFRQWTHLKEQMAPLPVFNRAFGGSRTGDILRSMDKIVVPYEPKIVVYYCGSNDINAGVSATAISDRVKEFFEQVIDRLPETQIFYVSINRAPQKRERWNVVDSANAMIKEYCSKAGNFGFIDVNPLLFDKENNPRYELYREDRLHLDDRAYEEFAAIIKPMLEKVWKER